MQKLFIATLGLLLAAGCAPAALNPVLAPTAPVIRWVHGDGFVEQSQEALTVGVAYRRSGVRCVEFVVDVANGRSEAVALRPDEIQCILEEPAEAGKSPVTVQAADPEAKLRQLEAARAREVKTSSDASTIRGLFFLVDVVDTAAHAKDRTREENRQNALDRNDFRHALERDKRNAETTAEGIGNRRAEEAATLLRKHTLEAGQRVRGRVEFHLDASQHRRCLVRVPAGGRVFEFEFRPEGR